MTDRVPLEVEVAWDEFHRTVNMTSQELRAWLLTVEADGAALPDDSDPRLRELGRHVVEILGKRKVDLTEGDADTMQQVVDFVAATAGSPPPRGAEDAAWRRSLMTVGHDPARPA